MKSRITAKDLRSMFSGKAITLGTQQPYYLLRYHSPDWYTCGVYGWNFDAYKIDGVLIMWGDRGTFGKRADYDRIKFYEEKAKEICNEVYTRTMTFDSIQARLNALIKDFIDEVIRG